MDGLTDQVGSLQTLNAKTLNLVLSADCCQETAKKCTKRDSHARAVREEHEDRADLFGSFCLFILNLFLLWLLFVFFFGDTVYVEVLASSTN